jgi:hypothetical protein
MHIKTISPDAAESLVPHPSPSEVEIAITKLKGYKSVGSDQIPAEPEKHDGSTVRQYIG